MKYIGYHLQIPATTKEKSHFYAGTSCKLEIRWWPSRTLKISWWHRCQLLYLPFFPTIRQMLQNVLRRITRKKLKCLVLWYITAHSYDLSKFAFKTSKPRPTALKQPGRCIRNSRSDRNAASDFKAFCQLHQSTGSVPQYWLHDLHIAQITESAVFRVGYCY